MAVDHPCPLCGHSLVGKEVGTRCPECALVIVPGAGIMRPRELFIVGIRLIGVWYLAATVDWVLGMTRLMRDPAANPMGGSVEDYAITLVAYLIVGVYCLFGAPHLVGMTYGHALARHAPIGKSGETKHPE